jgi:hypothetical protein
MRPLRQFAGNAARANALFNAVGKQICCPCFVTRLFWWAGFEWLDHQRSGQWMGARPLPLSQVRH